MHLQATSKASSIPEKAYLLVQLFITRKISYFFAFLCFFSSPKLDPDPDYEPKRMRTQVSNTYKKTFLVAKMGF